MTYLLTFVLAYCSVTYELLLGQTLSAFLGNTILRYSVTIGLYMFSMGLGALATNAWLRRNAVISLQLVELLLSVIGGSSLCCLFVLEYFGVPLVFLSLSAHLLIIVIGLLTGIEIPLLMEIRGRERKQTASSVLGVDYLGAFAGTLCFAFLFYPVVGLTQTAFVTASANAGAGSLLMVKARHIRPQHERLFRISTASLLMLFLLLLYCVWQADAINEVLLSLYLEN